MMDAQKDHEKFTWLDSLPTSHLLSEARTDQSPAMCRALAKRVEELRGELYNELG